MKNIILAGAAVLALTVAAAPAFACQSQNGVALNGIDTYSPEFNGTEMNGICLNGMFANGLTTNSLMTNGFMLNGRNLQGRSVNGSFARRQHESCVTGAEQACELSGVFGARSIRLANGTTLRLR